MLANAIILQAVKDYRTAYAAYRRNPNSKSACDEVTELVRFFTGSWYAELTSVNGEYLVRKLNAEIDAELRKRGTRWKSRD